MAGVIYEEFDPTKHVITAPYVFNPRHANYLAFDYGFSNPFVCLDIQVAPDDTITVWREYYKSYMSTHEHGVYLLNRENPPGYHIDAMWGDPRGADQAATLALTIGYPAFVDTPWSLAVEETKRLLKADKLFIHASCTNLIRQMTQLRVKEQARNAKQDLQELSGDGNIQHKVDDHAADALRYFIGPQYVEGAGISLAEVRGQANNPDYTPYQGSESEDFFKLNTQVTLDDLVKL
jgi:hypothetical protein